MPGPLDHLVVVELAQSMPAAIAAMLLCDHGADVVKVEPRGGNFFAHDLTRKSWDRSKRSVELDIELAADRKALRGLLAGADILIHAMDEDEAAKLGLDEASLKRDFPALVSVAMTAYGADTPFAGRPHGEALAAALLGTMVDRSSPFRPGPVYLGHPALHYGQAFLATIGALAAVRARREIGHGQRVEASLLDAMIAQSPMNDWWQEDGISYIKKGDAGAMDRFGNTRLVTGMFECGDGQFLQFHTGGPGGFKAAMDVLGFGDRVQTIGGAEMRVPLTEEEYKIARVEVPEVFKTRPRDEWIRLLHAADSAALPVLHPAEVLLDDQVEFVGQRISLPDPDFGTIYQAAPAVIFKGTPCAAPRPAPAIGANNGDLASLTARPAPKIATSGRAIKRPLEGIKVVDFSSFFAVGFGGRLLSDLGADVIKVETPGGDQMRPLPDCFDAAQRGKRAMVLDLKTPEALEAAYKLVATADVVTHNLRPGKADKLGIGFEKLLSINPRLIYAYMPGYGSRGPKSLLKSFAPLVSGWTGLLREGGGEGNPPTRSVFGNEDYNNGFLAAAGILMALERRAVSGVGDYMECPQLHSSLWTTSEHFLNADKQVVYGFRLDKDQAGINALDRIYRTTDGWLCISCRADDRFAALGFAVGLPQLAEDPRFATPRARSEHDGQLQALLTPFFAARSSADAYAALDAAGAPCEIVREKSWVREALMEDWAQASNRVVEDLDSMYGHVRTFGSFIHLSETSGFASGTAPRLGHHTRQILGEVGYSEAEIDALIAGGKAMQAERITGRIGGPRVSAA
ncbi:crotonobetainyl-CoA:carnitine CoA-transferase CaiB-like acyl-CoA transferase [Novosphingobium sp. SG751A]|uniref:CaiB/BaiF CoA-transferase family protein n=1 Tax=Novosphingobium sp. SG751A TaxID=2587000 RepID=UPI001553B6E8|nr:CoA transferase [Novosphingobium sp. SG751A]NOW48223.1 crotonobetainyl-CoA:carnitine CoA-transferase CaiB-like acyl-CoA transferase [Novosphingobium sp. SG751A]